ncbi:3,4-dihydroxy-2-butanone-4-phosphate synthase [Rhodococcus koreensis]
MTHMQTRRSVEYLRPRASQRDRQWYDAVSAIADEHPIVAIHRHGASLVRSVENITTPQMAELIRLTSGFVQVALLEDRCDALLLGEAIPTQRHRRGIAYGQSVSVDAAVGIGTGISASDRARTARVLSDPCSQPCDLTRPGHVIPVRVKSADEWSLGAALLRLVQDAGSAAGAFAELVPTADPTRTVGPEEAMAIAAELGTVTVALDV